MQEAGSLFQSLTMSLPPAMQYLWLNAFCIGFALGVFPFKKANGLPLRMLVAFLSSLAVVFLNAFICGVVTTGFVDSRAMDILGGGIRGLAGAGLMFAFLGVSVDYSIAGMCRRLGS